MFSIVEINAAIYPHLTKETTEVQKKIIFPVIFCLEEKEKEEKRTKICLRKGQNSRLSKGIYFSLSLPKFTSNGRKLMHVTTIKHKMI
jgi:hypothetical protein